MRKNTYKLIKPYPGRKIGDIALYSPEINMGHFIWETDSVSIPREFQPDLTPDWFARVKYLFTTTDGVDKYEGDSWFYVVHDNPEYGVKTTNTLEYRGSNPSKTSKFNGYNAAREFAATLCKKPLWKTEDGKGIFEGEKYWVINTATWSEPWERQAEARTHIAGTWKLFLTQDKAEDFYLMNKPCLSINEISKVYVTANRFSTYKKDYEKQARMLRTIVKNKK